MAPKMLGLRFIMDPNIGSKEERCVRTKLRKRMGKQKYGSLSSFHRTKWLDARGSLKDFVGNPGLIKQDGQQQASKSCSHYQNMRVQAIADWGNRGRVLERRVVKLDGFLGTMGVHVGLARWRMSD